ncbi:MAG: hypothetical protein U0234_06935 [Sandaracinus sp.]
MADRAPADDDAQERRERRNRVLKNVAKGLLVVLGIAAVVALVNEAGPDAVFRTLLDAAVFLPAILALEIGFMSMDVFALRAFLGERGANVPFLVWLRTAMLAYGVMILLPAGRAGGEVARAAGLTPYVGGSRAAALATRLQAATLIGNTLISIPCYVAVGLASDNFGAGLAWAVLINGVGTGLIGGAIIFASRRSSVGSFLGKRIRALASHGEDFDEALRDDVAWGRPIALTFFGRGLQAVQYGLILLAVGGTLTPLSALVSQGIHLVGAGFGDLVPNQVGITEGAYRLFASTLGLADAPARAIGIALIARLCQFFLAGVSLGVSALWKPATPASAPVTVRAGSASP